LGGGKGRKISMPESDRGGDRNDTYLRRKRKNEEVKSISYTRVLVWELSFVSLAIEGSAQK
jgi:hypothetical protein